MIRNHFSLNAWHPFGDSQFWLIRADADWCRGETIADAGFNYPGWFAVTFALLGCGFCLTYWPQGKLVK